ncbi:unnamed protein product, partial [Rotaria magnacalcarata]
MENKKSNKRNSALDNFVISSKKLRDENINLNFISNPSSSSSTSTTMNALTCSSPSDNSSTCFIGTDAANLTLNTEYSSPKSSLTTYPTDVSRTSEDPPSQPRLAIYPIDKDNRSFQERWYSNHPWMEYSIKLDSVFCYFCRHFSQGSTPTRIQRDAFTTSGFNTWKRALARNRDPNIDEFNVKFPNSIARLRSIVSWIKVFTLPDDCVDYLTDVTDENVFLFVENSFGKQLVPLIHELPQLYSIFVFCNDNDEQQTWTKEWTKVNGIFTQAEQICSLLKDNVKQCDHNTIPISIVSVDDLSKPNLNELEPLFMFSQILKEILLEMAYDERAEKKLVQFWREQYYDNASILKIVDEFEQDCHRHTPIWWYTRDFFIYSMINRALRTMDTEVIIKMGFFLLAVHQQIQELHRQQSNTRVPLTVYRGQTISNSEFQKLSNSKGDPLSFNSFMSTNVDPEVANVFCSNLEPNTTGILLKIEIDPSFSSNPFALLTNVSYFFDQEKEILLSTHAIFRIGEMIEIENRLWHVQLILTTDNDKQLEV